MLGPDDGGPVRPAAVLGEEVLALLHRVPVSPVKSLDRSRNGKFSNTVSVSIIYFVCWKSYNI